MEYVDWGVPKKGSVSYSPKTAENKLINIQPKGGSDFNIGIDKSGKIIEGKSEWIGKNLDEALGKGLADKIMEKPKGSLEGEGLEFGGEWASNLYDRQVKNIVEDLTGGKVGTMDLGLPVSANKSEVFTTPRAFEKYQTTGDSTHLSQKPKFKVGEEIVRTTEGTEQLYLITDVLKDGKFKAFPKEVGTDDFIKRITTGKITAADKKTIDNFSEQFDISTKTTKQQGIRLTPAIKAKIRGEAPKLKAPSGRSPIQ